MNFLSLYKLLVIIFISYTFALGDILPRFASIKSNNANARVGPGVNYPIIWIFVNKFEPVEIIKEFQEWRLINDIDGLIGWVHISVLTTKRSIITINKNIEFLYKSPRENSKIIAQISPKLRCSFQRCKSLWCLINCKGYSGWFKRSFIWGINEHD